LPARQNLADERTVEEERRLFYVGCTRARETLWCSHAQRRWRFGSVSPMVPSRFLADVPTGAYRLQDESLSGLTRMPRVAPGAHPAPSRRGPEKRTTPEPPPREPSYEDYSQEEVLLRMGQRVRHKKYGIGRVLSVSGFSNDMRVTVLFNDGARRQMLAKFAGLEIP